jgi:carbon-monoxide dehydrogenase large subunit
MTPVTPVLPKLVGQRVKRREDPRLIQGRATYVDDIALVGMQHRVQAQRRRARRIRTIDTKVASAMDGVEPSTRAPTSRSARADADRHRFPP